jgi:hypothetical protein
MSVSIISSSFSPSVMDCFEGKLFSPMTGMSQVNFFNSSFIIESCGQVFPFLHQDSINYLSFDSQAKLNDLLYLP